MPPRSGLASLPSLAAGLVHVSECGLEASQKPAEAFQPGQGGQRARVQIGHMAHGHGVAWHGAMQHGTGHGMAWLGVVCTCSWSPWHAMLLLAQLPSLLY